MFKTPSDALIFLIERCRMSPAPLGEAERTIAMINEASAVIQKLILTDEKAKVIHPAQPDEAK